VSVVQPGDEPLDELTSPEATSGPTVLRILLGTQLRKLREAAGITPDQAGYEIRASRSKISRVEHGRVSFKERDVADLLTLYGVTEEGERRRMLSVHSRGQREAIPKSHLSATIAPRPARTTAGMGSFSSGGGVSTT